MLKTLAILLLSATQSFALSIPCPDGQVPTTEFVEMLRSKPGVQVFGYEGDHAKAARTYIEMKINTKAKPFDQMLIFTHKANPTVLLTIALNGCVYHSTELSLTTWNEMKIFLDGV